MHFEQELRKCLADLEERIDPKVESGLLADWIAFTQGHWSGEVFTPSRPASAPPKVEWPFVPVNVALHDKDAMALQQFAGCSGILQSGAGHLMCVRCNYGTSILPSIFEAEIFYMDEKLNTLPTSRPLPGGADAMKALLDKGAPDLRASQGGAVLEMGTYFAELVADYPRIRECVRIYHPDIQGPMDLCELLWGSSLFVDIYDYPDLVKELLELVTDTYIHFMREWNKIIEPAGDYSVHWSMMHQGQVMLRDDSAMNFSPRMYEEFIRPYDQRIFDELGGGAIHFCGRGDHFIEPMSEMRGLYAVNVSQPELNDMETIFANTVDKGIKLIGLARSAADAALDSGRSLRGQAHC